MDYKLHPTNTNVIRRELDSKIDIYLKHCATWIWQQTFYIIWEEGTIEFY